MGKTTSGRSILSIFESTILSQKRCQYGLIKVSSKYGLDKSPWEKTSPTKKFFPTSNKSRTKKTTRASRKVREFREKGLLEDCCCKRREKDIRHFSKRYFSTSRLILFSSNLLRIFSLAAIEIPRYSLKLISQQLKISRMVLASK